MRDMWTLPAVGVISMSYARPFGAEHFGGEDGMGVVEDAAEEGVDEA